MSSNWKIVKQADSAELTAEDDANALAVRELLFSPPSGFEKEEARQLAAFLCVY